MSEKIGNIAKNTSYFTIALILQKVISFSYFTIIARYLPPDDLGKYYFAISFTSIFGIFIDIGLANVLIREVARPGNGLVEGQNPKEAKKIYSSRILGTVLAIKIPTAVFSLLMVVLFANLLGYPEITKFLIYLSSMCMILDSFSLTLFGVARGFHNLLYESIASFFFQLVILLTGLLIIWLDWGLRWLMIAIVAASLFYFIYSAFLVRFKLGIIIWPIFEMSAIKKMIAISIPFALFGILQKFYTYIDSVLLSTIAGDYYTGLYQISFKIIYALQFLPLAFIATLYPAFSAYWHNNREQLAISFERAMNYLMIVSLPISFGIIAVADKIVGIFSEQYVAAIPALQIIMLALLFIFINYPIGSALNACDRQSKNTLNMAIVMVFSVIMNLLLIPRFNIIGASITVVASNSLMFILGIFQVRKFLPFRGGRLLFFFGKVLLSALAMAWLAWYLKREFNIIIVILLAAIFYGGAIYLSGAVKKADILSVYQSFRRKGAKV